MQEIIGNLVYDYSSHFMMEFVILTVVTLHALTGVI
jgi:hypothetical protein